MAVRVVFFCCLLLWSALAAAFVPPIDIAATPTVLRLARAVAVHVEPDKARAIGDILALPDSAWQRNPHDLIHPGDSSDDRWVRVPLVNSAAGPRQVLLEIGWAQLDVVEAHVLADGVVIEQWMTGDHRPFASRPLPTRTFVFPLELPGGSARELMLRLGMQESLFEPISLGLYEPSQFVGREQREYLLYGAYYGGLIVMLLYHAFLFSVSRQRAALFYALYLFFLGLWHTDFVGFGHQYLWSSKAWSNIQLLVNWCVLACAVAFVSCFMRLPQHLPRLNRWLWRLLSLIAVLLAIELVDPQGRLLPTFWLINTRLVLDTVLALLSIHAVLSVSRWGLSHVRFFLLGWACLVAGLVVYMLFTSFPDLLPFNILTENGITIGSGLQLILLGLALGGLLRQSMDDKLAAEQRANAIQSAYTSQLEAEVSSRTAELRQAVQRTEASLAKEQQARSEQQTFLATVSHELRTPLAVIDTVAQNLMLDADDTTIELSRQRHEKILQATGRLTALLDDYLDEYRFSLLRDQRPREARNLRQLLEETVSAATSLANGHHIVIEAVEVEGDIICDHEATALALRNLVDNAMKYTPPQTTVRLSAGRAGQRATDGVWIEVADDGPGMSRQQVERYFEVPERGQNAQGVAGKGLGLILVRRMIEQQGGTVTVSCAPGQGCRFRIWLPDDARVQLRRSGALKL